MSVTTAGPGQPAQVPSEAATAAALTYLAGKLAYRYAKSS